MFFKASFIAAFLAAVATAAPSPSGHVLHEQRTAPLRQWAKRDAVPSTVVLPMRIGMVQSNLDKGHEMLMEASNPASSQYSNWLSQEEITDLFAPPQAAVDGIRQWLESAGIAAERISQSANRQWMQFDATTAEAEELLKTKYHVYEHTSSGRVNVACDEYHVPQHVTQHIDYITPGLRLLGGRAPEGSKLAKRGGPGNVSPKIKGPAPSLSGLSDAALLGLCDVAITPICIQTEYNITQGTLAAKGNELGIFEDLGDYLNLNDLHEFLLLFQLGKIPPTTSPIFKGIDGAVDDQTTPGPESDLDFQISYPIIYPQNSILFQTDDSPTEANYTYAGFLNNFLDAIDGSYCNPKEETLDPPYPDPSNAPGSYKKPKQCGVYTPPHVLSVSYGGQEADLPASYQTRQCNEFMKLGLAGTTVVIASGDSGVSGPAGDDNADGCLGSGAQAGKVFSPDFPATCPYITAVGSTVLTGDVRSDQETATTRFPSGGGFSNIYPIPSYQKTQVADYLKFERATTKYPEYSTTGQSDPAAPYAKNGGIFNNNGRGYPDVSAVGDNVVVVVGGMPTLIGGTSAAAPVFASIINRINEERIKAGKKTVGLVNPVLYANPGDFHDITVGNNSGCGTAGFYATKGWDPVTGLGTPNYPALLKTFLALK